MIEFIDYPKISREETGRYLLKLRLPKDYKEWVKRITPQFTEGIEKRVRATQQMFGLEKYNPVLRWDRKKGLVSIVIGFDDACVRLGDMGNYYFNNIRLPEEALALIDILSFYLDNLQNLNAVQMSQKAK